MRIECDIIKGNLHRNHSGLQLYGAAVLRLQEDNANN